MVASACRHVDDSAPAGVKKPPAKKARLCERCRAEVPAKPRATMPLDHAVEVVRSILIGRLDDLCGEWLEGDGRRYHLTTTQWLELFQSMQLKLFPEEFGEDGEEYTPAPDARMKEREELTWVMVKVVGDDGTVTTKRMAEMRTVPVKPRVGGLVPRKATTAIYARYLLAGKQSPAAKLTMATTDAGGNAVVVPVLGEADLVVLAQRAERREVGRAVGA